MNSNSIHVCNLLRKEKHQSELYLGNISYTWEYLISSYTADCTEALPLTLLDKAICGVLDVDGSLTFEQLGAILGLNVCDAPDSGEYRDSAEYSLLQSGIQALLDYNMIARDFSDGTISLTDIGREYYRQGKKFRTTVAKQFDVYFDMTGGNHGMARKIFKDVEGRTGRTITPAAFRNEQFLKEFIHEQLPAIYDTEKGNSFTNVSSSTYSYLERVPVEVGILFDVVNKVFRYVAILDDKVSQELSSIIASNEKLRSDLEDQAQDLLRDASTQVDRPVQDAFESGLQEMDGAAEPQEGDTITIAAVMEPEEFWQGLTLLVPENEKSVFIRAGEIDEEECKAIDALCVNHPGTNVFLSYTRCYADITFRPNLFHIQKEMDGDYLLCTSNQMYMVRGYALTGGNLFADMVFHYTDTEIDESDLRGPFAVGLLSQMYTDAMSFLDTDFEIAKRSVRSISHCDERILVFRDFLNEESIAKLEAKKQEVFNRVKLQYEKVLIEKLADITGKTDLEEIEKVKELEEISQKVDSILGEADETYITLMENGRAFKQALKDRERTIRDELMAKTYIIDTNVFLNDPEILSKIKKPNKMVLSGQVLQELDKKKNKADDPTLAANARKAVNAIRAMQEKERRSKKKSLLLEWADMSLLPEELQTRKGDNFILGVAMKFREQNPWMITSDNIFAITTESLGIPAVCLDEFYKKNGLEPPVKKDASTEAPKNYMDVYNAIYDQKGYVVLDRLEKDCRKAGVIAADLTHEAFADLISADPDLTMNTNAKGVTYVNIKR